MESPAPKFSITYSLADQSFARTKSIGILNASVDLLHALTRRSECARMTALTNHSLDERLALPPGVAIEHHDEAIASDLGRIWWDQWGVYTAARRTGHEWLFLPKGFSSFLRDGPMRTATFVHDVMQDHYDRHYPGTVSAPEAMYFRASLRASLRKSEIIFTPSEDTLKGVTRVARELGLRLPQMICCGEGFYRPAVAPETERRDMIVLASRFPHKLTRQAVKFLDKWTRHHPNEEIVHWVGTLPDNMEFPSHSNWRQHGKLPEPEFRSLMSRARVVIFFSDYEGFGRPPVEAVLAGACPVYSDIPTTREVMNRNGCPFDNASYESFASALDKALAAAPGQIRQWAEELARRHSWDAVAERVATALATTSKPARVGGASTAANPSIRA
jgi:glycosyltransferase involved in cell wall biosynthesis